MRHCSREYIVAHFYNTTLTMAALTRSRSSDIMMLVTVVIALLSANGCNKGLKILRVLWGHRIISKWRILKTEMRASTLAQHNSTVIQVLADTVGIRDGDSSDLFERYSAHERNSAAHQVSNAHQRDPVTNQNV